MAICSVLVFGLLFASIKFDVDNEFVTFCAPIGFLAAIVNLCLCLAEKRKHPSEKKPFKGFMMVVDYFTLVCFILVICGSFNFDWAYRQFSTPDNRVDLFLSANRAICLLGRKTERRAP